MRKTTKAISVLLTLVMVIGLMAVAGMTTASAAAPVIYISKDNVDNLAKDSDGFVYVEQGTNVRFWINMTDFPFINSYWDSNNLNVMDYTTGGRLDQRGDFTAKKLGISTIEGRVVSGSEYTPTCDSLKVKIRVVKKGTITLAAPQITKITHDPASGGAILKWDGESAKYRVFFKNAQNKWQKLGDGNKNVFADKTLKLGETRVYTVRALSAYGNYISGYNGSGWKFTNLLDTPIITKFKGEYNGCRINISAVPGAKMYRVFSQVNGKWKMLGDTSTTTFLDTRAVSGKSYTYTVRCLTADGKQFASAYNKKGWSCTYVQPYPVLTRLSYWHDSDSGARPTMIEVKNDSPVIDSYAFFIKSGGSWVKLHAKKFEEGNPYGLESNKFLVSIPEFYYGQEHILTIRGVNASGKYCSRYYSKGWTIHTMGPAQNAYRTSSKSFNWDDVTGATAYYVEFQNPYFQKIGSYWTDTSDLIVEDNPLLATNCYMTITPYDDGVCVGEMTMVSLTSGVG